MLTDARFPCEHGWYDRHEWAGASNDPENYGVCPGGSPVATADLEGLGETVWFCGSQYAAGMEEYCVLTSSSVHFPRCGWRLLIPIKDGPPPD